MLTQYENFKIKRMYFSLENPNIVWGHILTNPFLEKFYWAKLFQFPINFFPELVYYCVPLEDTLVKSILYLYDESGSIQK